MTEKWNSWWGDEEETEESQENKKAKKNSGEEPIPEMQNVSTSQFPDYLPHNRSYGEQDYPDMPRLYERPGLRTPDVTNYLPLNLNGTVAQKPTTPEESSTAPDTLTSPPAVPPTPPSPTTEETLPQAP